MAEGQPPMPLCDHLSLITCSSFSDGTLISHPPGWKWKWSRSVMSDSATLWTVAYQASPSMGFSRQEYWSGLPFPSPGDLPDPGIKPRSPTLQADALPSEPLREASRVGQQDSWEPHLGLENSLLSCCGHSSHRDNSFIVFWKHRLCQDDRCPGLGPQWWHSTSSFLFAEDMRRVVSRNSEVWGGLFQVWTVPASEPL